MKIEELKLSTRTLNCLTNAGITTVEELQEKKEQEIRAIKNMSDRKIVEIRMALERAEKSVTSKPLPKVVEPKEVPVIDVYNTNIGIIKKYLIDAAMNFCAVGYYLKEIRDKEQYKEAGYSDIWECALAEFGLSKSAASRHMKMNDMYSVGGNSVELDKKYISFNKSQLQEMLSLPESEREKVTPATTVAEIRKLNPNSKASKEAVATSQQTEVMKKVITPQPELVKPDEERTTKPEPIVLPDLEPGIFNDDVEDNPEVVATSQQAVEEPKEQEDFLIKIRDNCLFDSSNKCNIRNIKEVAKELGINCKYTCCYSCHETSCGARCNTSANILAQANENVAISQPVPAEVPAETIIDGTFREIVEETPEITQLELPVLKNMDEREQFIKDYKKWPVWCKNEFTEETFYRFDLPDGSSIVVKSYPTWLGWKKIDVEHCSYYLLKPGYHHFADTETNMTSLKDHLKEVQKNRKE